MNELRLDVRHELPGWTLFWADLELQAGSEAALASLRADVGARARASHTLEGLSAHPTAAAVRRLFRQAGCDPTRHRPSSEALLRRRARRGRSFPRSTRWWTSTTASRWSWSCRGA